MALSEQRNHRRDVGFFSQKAISNLGPFAPKPYLNAGSRPVLTATC
jgi:hypothetical protein